MKKHHKTWNQKIPVTINEAWEFFSRPENLNSITPSDFKIHLTKDISKVKLHKGMEIEYKMHPIFNLPITWTTRITELKELDYFIYSQEKGPYALWIHEHYFEEMDDGVLMTDILTYALNWGFIGEWLNHLFIRKRINQIFEIRKRRIKEIFNDGH